MEIDLRQVVREELEKSSEPDPTIVAHGLASRIDDAELRSALAQCLPTFVRIVSNEMRRTSAPVPEPGASATAAAADSVRRWAHIRESIDAREWRFLLDMTRDEVHRCAELRRTKARENLTAASHYDEIVVAMQRHGAKVVRNLPLAVLEELLP